MASMISGVDIRDDLEGEDDEDRKNALCGEYVNVREVNDIINRLLFDIEREIEEKQREDERQKMLKEPYKKFLFVEDGSVDIEELEQEMEMKNPEIKVVVYRNGANKPELLDLGEEK